MLRALAQLGRHALSAGLQSWWKRWLRKTRTTSPGSILADAAKNPGPTWLTGPWARGSPMTDGA
eukprot:2639094-Pyramimonas_sp.AAC.1